ncbi:hypothetical protein [Bartonella raoultii]|nr:hypothetical protein [Bartonella raoultii]
MGGRVWDACRWRVLLVDVLSVEWIVVGMVRVISELRCGWHLCSVG